MRDKCLIYTICQAHTISNIVSSVRDNCDKLGLDKTLFSTVDTFLKDVKKCKDTKKNPSLSKNLVAELKKMEVPEADKFEIYQRKHHVERNEKTVENASKYVTQLPTIKVFQITVPDNNFS